MPAANLYAILSVIGVSLISLVGLFTLSIKTEMGQKTLKFFVSFSVGALLGDVFIHLLPELASENNLELKTSIVILGSILFFFLTEGLIHWHRHHSESDEEEHHYHPVVYLNLIGDGLHNFIDGLIIGAAYMIDVQVGLATTLAVILHEIPQEIGDFGVLLYGGFSKAKALFFNFLSALTALIGVIIALSIGEVEKFAPIIVSIGIGSFIYIALADLVPEIHKSRGSKIIFQALALFLGIAVMFALLAIR